MSTVVKTVKVREKRHASIAYLLWGLGILGACGFQRLYLGHYRLGIAMLATLGFCGIGQLVDFAFLLQATRKVNASNGYSGSPDSYQVEVAKSEESDGKERDTTVPIETLGLDHFEEWNQAHLSIEETIKKLRE